MGRSLELSEHWLEQITELLRGMEYGSLLITVHDGAIVQIDRTERKRFDSRTIPIQPISESPPPGKS